MTIILLTAFITVILSYFFYKPIYKYNIFLYLITVLIAVVFHEDANLITLGYIPFGIFLVVMYSGVLDKGNLRKRLFMVRAELAVIGSILIAPHAFGYLEYFLEDIGLSNANFSFFIGFISVLIMAPLTVTSIQYIRRKMNYKEWKKLHLLAYLFYLLVGLHLIFIDNSRQDLYIIIFSIYFILKGSMLIPAYLEKQKNLNKRTSE